MFTLFSGRDLSPNNSYFLVCNKLDTWSPSTSEKGAIKLSEMNPFNNISGINPDKDIICCSGWVPHPVGSSDNENL